MYEGLGLRIPGSAQGSRLRVRKAGELRPLSHELGP